MPDGRDGLRAAASAAKPPGRKITMMTGRHAARAKTSTHDLARISQCAVERCRPLAGGLPMPGPRVSFLPRRLDTRTRAYLRKHFQSTRSRFLSTYSSHLPIPNSSEASNASFLISVCR